MTLYRGQFRVESARLSDWDYRSHGWYFVTVCTAGRELAFGDVLNGQLVHSKLGLSAETQLRALPSHYGNVGLDECVVMPNHIHAIIVIEGKHSYTPHLELETVRNEKIRPDGMPLPPRAGSLSAILRSYKAGVTRWAAVSGLPDFKWQSRFYDHLLRTNKSVDAVRDYIQSNPMNWLEDEFYPGNIL